jgi:hypothetical protein
MYKSEYEAFISSPIWKEILATLKETEAGLLEDLKELDPNVEATSIARQQGRIKMLNFVISMPEDILREIEENIKKGGE